MVTVFSAAVLKVETCFQQDSLEESFKTEGLECRTRNPEGVYSRDLKFNLDFEWPKGVGLQMVRVSNWI